MTKSKQELIEDYQEILNKLDELTTERKTLKAKIYDLDKQIQPMLDRVDEINDEEIKLNHIITRYYSGALYIDKRMDVHCEKALRELYEVERKDYCWYRTDISSAPTFDEYLKKHEYKKITVEED